MVTTSAFAIGVVIDWLDVIADDEGFTPSAREGAEYAIRVGYVLRLVEESEGTARSLDGTVLARMEQARAEGPERRLQDYESVLNDPEISDLDRRYFEQLRDRGNEYPYEGEREVLDDLILGEGPEAWFVGSRFFHLSGYKPEVWNVFVLKLTGVVNETLEPDSSVFPWEAIEQFVRFGYVLRCGDAFNGYTPEHVGGGDWQ